MRHPHSRLVFYSLTSFFSTTERGHSFEDDDDDDDGLDERATDVTVRFTLSVFAGNRIRQSFRSRSANGW